MKNKSVYSVCSLRVKFNLDLSFSEMSRLYSIKFKKVLTHRLRKPKEKLERVHEKNFVNSKNIQRNFQFG